VLCSRHARGSCLLIPINATCLLVSYALLCSCSMCPSNARTPCERLSSLLTVGVCLLFEHVQSGYNYGGYLTQALITAGFSPEDIVKIKIWNSGPSAIVFCWSFDASSAL
jgi:hypothetical protein